MKHKFLAITLLFPTLFSCNNENNASSNTSSKTQLELTLEELDKIKLGLKAYQSTPDSKTYSNDQIDCYGEFEFESKQSGKVTHYLDNFSLDVYNQIIGDSTSENIKREKGISENKIYDCIYYGENDSSNKVTYYENNDYNRENMLNFDFYTQYIFESIDVIFEQIMDESVLFNFESNIDEIEFKNNSTVNLKIRFYTYDSSDSTFKLINYERDDDITIVDNKIKKVETIVLYGQQNNINYNYIVKTEEFTYNELTQYNGDKVDLSTIN